MTIDHCAGCADDFYNGHNPYGVERCWHFQKAELKEYILIHISQPPPYTRRKIETLPNCYKRREYSKVKPEALTAEGYWK